MAQLSPVRFRALDASGALVSGAGLFVYEVGTTTLATIYSDADLLVPTANPVISNATGYWAQFYTASGETFDIQARATSSAASTLLWEALEVDSVGQEDNGTFTRDFAGNGRVQIRGAAGVTRLEFGPPTGDNIGGTYVIGGWNGTDPDAGTLLGSITFDSDVQEFQKYKTGGTVTAQADLAIALDTSFEEWEIRFRNVVMSTDGYLQGHLSFDGAATYKTTGGDYMYQSVGTSGSGALNETRTSAALIRLMAAVGAAATTEGGDIVLRLTSKAGRETRVWSEFAFDGATATVDHSIGVYFTATNLKNFGKATHLKVSPTGGGTVSFDYAVYGIR